MSKCVSNLRTKEVRQVGKLNFENQLNCINPNWNTKFVFVSSSLPSVCVCVCAVVIPRKMSKYIKYASLNAKYGIKKNSRNCNCIQTSMAQSKLGNRPNWLVTNEYRRNYSYIVYLHCALIGFYGMVFCGSTHAKSGYFRLIVARLFKPIVITSILAFRT